MRTRRRARSGGRSVLMVVENLPVPFDRRVWRQAQTLRDEGYEVTVVCPTGKGADARQETRDGVRILRHPMPTEGAGPLGYLREYSAALYWEFRLARRAYRERPFDVIHICNPPDLIFLVALWFRVLHGVRVLFDHHDLNPELYVAKYGRRDVFHLALRVLERLTYASAHHVIATNESYRAVAMSRGRKRARDVTVVRSAPALDNFQADGSDDAYRRGRRHLVGYVGVMGPQEGLDLLLESVRHLVHDRSRDDIQFMLVGSGTSFVELTELARELDVADHVEFTGRVSDEELMTRLASADLCVNPDPANGFNEYCTMNKIMEYMTLEKPIVQFDLAEGRRSAEGGVRVRPAERHWSRSRGRDRRRARRRAVAGPHGARRATSACATSSPGTTSSRACCAPTGQVRR